MTDGEPSDPTAPRPPWHGAVLEIPQRKPGPGAVCLPIEGGDVLVTGHPGLVLACIDFERFYKALDPFYALPPVEDWPAAHREQEIAYFRTGKIPAAKVHAEYSGRLSASLFGLELMRLRIDAPGRPDVRVDRSWLRLGWRFEPRTAFTNGRHRLRMMQHLGAPCGVVAVNPMEACVLAEICGSSGEGEGSL